MSILSSVLGGIKTGIESITGKGSGDFLISTSGVGSIKGVEQKPSYSLNIGNLAAAVGVSAPAAVLTTSKTISALPAVSTGTTAIKNIIQSVIDKPKEALIKTTVVGIGIPATVGLLSTSGGRAAVSSIPSKAAAAGSDIGKVLSGDMSIIDFAKENKAITGAAIVGGAAVLGTAAIIGSNLIKSSKGVTVNIPKEEKSISSNTQVIPTGAITTSNISKSPSVVPVSSNIPTVTKTGVRKRKVYKPKQIIPINNRINNNIQVNVRR